MEILKLDKNNFNEKSLDKFIRRQQVTECWRRDGESYVLKKISYTEDWNGAQLKETAQRIINGLKRGCIAYGAFMDGEIVGFAVIENELFGAGYIDLAEFHVSESYRRQGIGRALFKYACAGARKLGAKKLYISAHSAKESIAAYESYGCVFAKEINRELAEKEPCDLQLEFDLFKG